ncbi:hypothetical protein XENTR_v10012967 [Xenopus tropicalis]|uniref:Leucine-rich repeat and transmembrane domain-containing protein 1 n=1 Tax=Xenopus tropicalis TaxID=8364 RepID=A0A803JQY2_XENTR|nr:leucine-rich repeat and transmembrane domain-containing protein 1 [Xenopus tropicalis]KAE8612746.1 hypothetical protein XENTR_v10012967 [Xenopus tropicalis]|eukprot:XP_012817240.1 PREDICTED: leucine-rich repeat and transmembrane domain-containing protein 1 [Xenopus tropicalis]
MKGGLLLASSVILAFHAAWGCPDVCSCQSSSRTVDCSYRGLAEVPALVPPQTQILYLQGNQIGSLNRASFANISGLQFLDLSNNSISALSLQVFAALHDLKKLDLSYNSLNALPELLGNQTRNLTFLAVKHNQIQRVDRSMLESLVNLKVLLVRSNPWQCNCQSMGLKLWLENFLYKGGFIDEVICNSPENRKGKDLLKIPFEMYRSCPPVAAPFLLANIHHHNSDYKNNGKHGHPTDAADGGSLPECEPKSKPRPVSLRHAIATVVITGVICGIVCLMMLAAAVYGCAYAAIMAKYQRQLKEVESLAPVAENGSPEEKEPLDSSLA